MTLADERTLAYLEEVLGLDPSEDSAAIGAAVRSYRSRNRSRSTGVRNHDPAAAESAGNERRRTLESIEALRDVFWTMDAARVEHILNGLDTSRDADLERAAVRLLAANGLRDEIEALEADPSAPSEAITTLRQALVAPTKEAALLRDELVRAMGRPKHSRKRKALLKAIGRHAPRLARQERRWLDRLRGARRERKDSRVMAGGIGCIGAYFIGSTLVRLLNYLIEMWGGS